MTACIFTDPVVLVSARGKTVSCGDKEVMIKCRANQTPDLHSWDLLVSREGEWTSSNPSTFVFPRLISSANFWEWHIITYCTNTSLRISMVYLVDQKQLGVVIEM